MKKPLQRNLPEYFRRYIHIAPNLDLLEALAISPFEEDKTQMAKFQNYAYAPHKWTINQIIRHCIDVERVMSYRALRFARNDQTPLMGFEEDTYAQHTEKTFDFDKLMIEFQVIRQATIFLFESFDPQSFTYSGIASEVELSVLEIGFIIAGHPFHHLKVIQERYFHH